MNVLPLINGIGRVHDASYRPVCLADSVINEDTLQTRHVFAEVRMEGRSRLTIGGDPPSATPLRSKFDSDPVLMEAVMRIGKSDTHSWDDLYKVYEVLKDGAGGRDSLLQRIGLTKKELDRFTRTANHPAASGELARHARMREQPPADPLSLEEGRQFIREMLQRW